MAQPGQPVYMMLQGSGATPAAATTALNTAIADQQASSSWKQWSPGGSPSAPPAATGPIFTGLNLTGLYDATSTLEVWSATIMMTATPAS